MFHIGQYDSFVLYALALNDTLAAGEDPRDGTKMFRRMRNRTFEGNKLIYYIPFSDISFQSVSFEIIEHILVILKIEYRLNRR